MRQLIDLPEGGAEAELEMMHLRAQRGDPEAPLQILNHIVSENPRRRGGPAMNNNRTPSNWTGPVIRFRMTVKRNDYLRA